MVTTNERSKTGHKNYLANVFNWFKRKQSYTEGAPILTDIHSHLIPGVDDGVKSLEESEFIIRRFLQAGYTKLITTPHVMSDSFRNTPDIILGGLSKLKKHLEEKDVSVHIEAAAEYYLDEDLIQKVENNEKLLSFGKNYILFETNFMTEPLQLKEFIFLLSTRGYTPVLAHPERYIYLQGNFERMSDLLNRGVLFQINISSLSGYYSIPAKKIAQKLIDRGWVHFLGSDCHSEQHIELLEKVKSDRYFQKALTLPLLNNSL